MEMRKIKRILILAIVTIIGVASFGCKPYQKPENLVFGDFEYKILNKDVKGRTPIAMIVGLSEVGQLKNTIIVPEQIDEYNTVFIGNSNLLGGFSGYWESDNLEKVYISQEVIVKNVEFLKKTSAKYVINMGQNDVSSKEFAESDKKYSYFGTQDSLNINTCFYLNYGKILSWYWVDIIYNERITVMPPEPTRNGYKFDGWYKEEECITPWDFDHDIVSEPVYDEEGKCINRLRLFAKWVKE